MQPPHMKAPKTVEEYTVEALREAILHAKFKAGERLNQTDLANWLGVSRMPIREALRKLETEGLVTFHPRRGAVVSRLSGTDVAEIYEIRSILEPHAMRLSIPRLTDSHLAELEERFQQMESSTDEFDRQGLRTAFYLHLYKLANRPRLVNMIERLRAEVGRYLLTKEVPHSHEAHDHILNLCRSRQADEAVRYLENHLSSIGAMLYSLLEE